MAYRCSICQAPVAEGSQCQCVNDPIRHQYKRTHHVPMVEAALTPTPTQADERMEMVRVMYGLKTVDKDGNPATRLELTPDELFALLRIAAAFRRTAKGE